MMVYEMIEAVFSLSGACEELFVYCTRIAQSEIRDLRRTRKR